MKRLNLEEALSAQEELRNINDEYEVLLDTQDGTYFDIVLIPKEYEFEFITLMYRTEIEDWLSEDQYEEK